MVWYGMVDQILIDTIRYDLIEDDLWWCHFGILLLQFLFLFSRCLHFDFSPILSISVFLSFIFSTLLSSPHSITFHPILSPFVLFIFFCHINFFLFLHRLLIFMPTLDVIIIQFDWLEHIILIQSSWGELPSSLSSLFPSLLFYSAITTARGWQLLLSLLPF